VVDVDGVGEVDAVAGLGAHAAPGDRVALAVDPGRVAVTPVGR
jgi:thiamine transport system ATP-binding protein